MLVNLLSSPGAVGVGKGVSQVHRGRYYVAVRRGGEDVKRDICVAIERLFQADSLKIVLWDEEEPTFLCVVRVTRTDYEELKKQQGLLIDFDNFPAQLVRLLQQCAASNMFLILQQSDPRQYYLEVVEHNEFKRLVHLSLKTTPATEADVRAHMAETIATLKNTLTATKNASSSSEVAWNDKCAALERKTQELTVSLARLEEDRRRRETEHQELLMIERDRLAQERLEWQRNIEHASKSHASSLQEAVTRKDKQLEEINTRCRQLKENVNSLETQLSDKSQRMGLLEKEVQKSHIEVATLRAKNSALERDGMERERQTHVLQTRCGDLEKTLRETNEQVKELTSNAQMLQREKLSMEQKLSLSESLVNKNNQALQSTSEQLLKANQIISKLNTDLIELKEKLLCRTAIVLEQEKVLEKGSQEIEDMKKREEEARGECSRLRDEKDALTTRLDSAEKSLKEKEETIKNNNLVIQWLHKKLEQESPSDPTGAAAPAAESAGPDSRRSDRRASPNAYYFSDALDNEDQCPSTRRTQDGHTNKADVPRSGKSGLDPRYLRPADEDKAQSARPDTAKGKENKTANLPKVNYNSKKLGRSVSYRTTPVSAYFPGK